MLLAEVDKHLPSIISSTKSKRSYHLIFRSFSHDVVEVSHHHSIHLTSSFGLNMQHCKAAMTHLALFIHKNKINILFIQEPYCLNGEPSLTPPNYSVFYLSPNTHPRALQLIRTEITQNFVLLHKFSNSDNVIVATAINPQYT